MVSSYMFGQHKAVFVALYLALFSTSGQSGAVDKPYPIFKLRDKIEEKTGWDGYADTDRR